MKISAETRFAVIPEWLLYADVSDAGVRLYAVLARHADKDGRSHPSRARLAELMRCSTKTVDRALKELSTLGALEVEKRFVNGSPTTNRFHLRTSDPATPVSLPLDTSVPTPSDTGDEGVATPESHGTRTIEREEPTTKGATRPSEDMLFLAEKLDNGNGKLTPAGLQKLIGKHGFPAVRTALSYGADSLEPGQPPINGSVYAWVDAVARDVASGELSEAG